MPQSMNAPDRVTVTAFRKAHSPTFAVGVPVGLPKGLEPALDFVPDLGLDLGFDGCIGKG